MSSAQQNFNQGQSHGQTQVKAQNCSLHFGEFVLHIYIMLTYDIFFFIMARLRLRTGFNQQRNQPLQLQRGLIQLLTQLDRLQRIRPLQPQTALILLLTQLGRLQGIRPLQPLIGLMLLLTQQAKRLRETRRKLLVFSNRLLTHI